MLAADTRQLRRLARQTFGFEALRPGQEEAIRAAAAGRDVLAVLPTGAGKSAIYQLAALIIPGPTVVVSPLIALQRDQVAALTANGVDAAEANSQVRAADRRQAFDDLIAGDLEFLFLAPEQLANAEVLEQTAAPSRRSSSSTRPTASAPGATTSAPTTCASARSPRPWAARRSSP